MGLRRAVFPLVLLLSAPFTGCRGPFAPPEYTRLGATEAGRIVREALRSQGYRGWRRAAGLAFTLRSRTGDAGRRVTTQEEVRLDTRTPRVVVRGNEGGAETVRLLDGSGYRAWKGNRPVRDPEVLVEGRLRTARDAFLTLLPFALGRRPAELERRPEAELGDGRYNVVSVRFEAKGAFPPDTAYTLCFRATTHRLEKVFFRAGSGARKGALIRCDLDNYADVEGTLIPIHRRFWKVDAMDAPRKGVPFLEEWLEEVRFENAPEDAFRP